MASLNNSNANVFYWPLSTGNKINTAYNIVPKLAKFFIDTTNDCPEITLKGHDKILFEYRDKLYYFYAVEYLVYSQEHFYCYNRKVYEALH